MLFKKYLGIVFFFLLLSSACVSASPPRKEKPIVIVVVSYNNTKWVDLNIESIFSQNYNNYRVVYIDDCSPDGTADAVQALVDRLGQQHRFTLVRNTTRAGSPLANHYKAIHEYCKDNEIIACLDGDDWLANSKVLNVINEYYSNYDIWLTHGSLKEYHKNNRNGTIGWSIPVPQKIISSNTFRLFRCPTHLKTFYAWLFKKIKLEDLMYEGKFFPATGDQAMMFPMVEMAGTRHKFIPKILYIYNMSNPLGESIVATQLQMDCEAYIRSLQPYAPLKKAGR